MKKAIHLLTFVLFLSFVALSAQVKVPAKPEPPRLVNDFAGILGDTQAMEDSLENIAVHTSNQICVVTMNDLGGMEPAMMAQAIGEQWGVGSTKYNNGVVILIKPKTEDSKGEVYIATGYGLQGGISDAKCSRIARKYMVPHFKDSDYVAGTWAGISEVYKLATQEYNEHQGGGKKRTGGINIWDLLMGGAVIGGVAYGVRRYHKRKNPQLPVEEGGAADEEGLESDIPGSIAAASVAGAAASDEEEEELEENEEEPTEEEEPEDPNKWHGFEGGKFGGSGGGSSW